MLATEPTTPTNDKHELLETWSHNERMRHVPSVAWMVQKLDVDLRRRIDKLFAVYAGLEHHHPAHAALEQQFRALCRAIDRVADVARRHRGQNHPPTDLGHRISWGLSHAVSNLQSMDPETAGKRLPFQTFERSNAEPLNAALLTVIEQTHRLHDTIRPIAPGIDEQIYADLVQLNEPLRREPMA